MSIEALQKSEQKCRRPAKDGTPGHLVLSQQHGKAMKPQGKNCSIDMAKEAGEQMMPMTYLYAVERVLKDYRIACAEDPVNIKKAELAKLQAEIEEALTAKDKAAQVAEHEQGKVSKLRLELVGLQRDEESMKKSNTKPSAKLDKKRQALGQLADESKLKDSPPGDLSADAGDDAPLLVQGAHKKLRAEILAAPEEAQEVWVQCPTHEVKLKITKASVGQVKCPKTSCSKVMQIVDDGSDDDSEFGPPS